MAESNRSAAPPAVPAEVSIMSENGKWVFRTDDAMAFYVFDKDKPGQSACDAECAKAWKPVLAHAGAKPLGAWTLMARKDGTKQWAYKGRPIYTYLADQPGQPKGDGSGGVWHVLNP